MVPADCAHVSCKQLTQKSMAIKIFLIQQMDLRVRNYKKKEDKACLPSFFASENFLDYFLPMLSSETVSFFLPFARRAANTLRPLAVDILSLKPCLFLRLLFDGWNVLFILFWLLFLLNFGAAKIQLFLKPTTPSQKIISTANTTMVHNRRPTHYNPYNHLFSFPQTVPPFPYTSD
jgi:hypothetical protein